MRQSLLITALALTLASRASAAENAASSIDRMTAALWPAKTVTANATLVSVNALGPGLDTEMTLVRYQKGADVSTQILVTAPELVRNTVYEVLSRGGKPLDRAVYFPALDRARDFSGIRRTDSFLASEFSYEDLEIAAPVDSEWRSAEPIEEGGRRLVRVASAWIIDPKTYLPVRAMYYDTQGSLLKRATFDQVENVDGHPIPTRIVMEDVQNGDKSELRFRDIRLNAPVDEKLFSESPIQKRRAKR